MLDFDPRSGRIRTTSADRIAAAAAAKDLRVAWILETHVHADHLSSAQHLRETTGAKVAIGVGVRDVQRHFRNVYNLGADFAVDGSQFDRLFAADEQFRIGRLDAQALLLGGHTPSDTAYRIGDTVFVGDALFMPDVGTARCDFPGGDAKRLYESLRRLLSLPAATRIGVCHDYPPAGRLPQWQTTVAEQRRSNIHARDGIDEAQFVRLRCERDATLDAPALLLAAIQVNIRAGRFPEPESNGVSYLKIPLRIEPDR